MVSRCPHSQENWKKVSVAGFDDHELPCLDKVTCVALIHTTHGKVSMIMHEYAYYGRGNTIHSPCHIEWFHNKCDDKSHHVGGKQVITFLGGYTTPLECRSGLMYMSIIGKPTDQESKKSSCVAHQSTQMGSICIGLCTSKHPCLSFLGT